MSEKAQTFRKALLVTIFLSSALLPAVAQLFYHQLNGGLDNFGGFAPQGNLIQGSDGAQYATMTTYGFATVFKLLTTGGGFTNLRSFSGPPGDSGHPLGRLTQGTNGMLFGTSSNGGANLKGTVFRINTNGGSYTNLKSFTGAGVDGSY